MTFHRPWSQAPLGTTRLEAPLPATRSKSFETGAPKQSLGTRKTLYSHRIDAVTVWSYVLLGWMSIPLARAYMELVPSAALWWVLIGGLCYTAGTVFLVLDLRRLHFHAIWHLFVMAGSICHFCGVFLFVACAPTLVP